MLLTSKYNHHTCSGRLCGRGDCPVIIPRGSPLPIIHASKCGTDSCMAFLFNGMIRRIGVPCDPFNNGWFERA